MGLLISKQIRGELDDSQPAVILVCGEKFPNVFALSAEASRIRGNARPFLAVHI